MLVLVSVRKTFGTGSPSAFMYLLVQKLNLFALLKRLKSSLLVQSMTK